MSKYNEFCLRCDAKLPVPSWKYCEDCSYKVKNPRCVDPPVQKTNEVERVKYEIVEIVDPELLEKYYEATVIVMNGNKIVGYSNTL